MGHLYWQPELSTVVPTEAVPQLSQIMASHKLPTKPGEPPWFRVGHCCRQCLRGSLLSSGRNGDTDSLVMMNPSEDPLKVQTKEESIDVSVKVEAFEEPFHYDTICSLPPSHCSPQAVSGELLSSFLGKARQQMFMYLNIHVSPLPRLCEWWGTTGCWNICCQTLDTNLMLLCNV